MTARAVILFWLGLVDVFQELFDVQLPADISRVFHDKQLLHLAN